MILFIENISIKAKRICSYKQVTNSFESQFIQLNLTNVCVWASIEQIQVRLKLTVKNITNQYVHHCIARKGTINIRCLKMKIEKILKNG